MPVIPLSEIQIFTCSEGLHCNALQISVFTLVGYIIIVAFCVISPTRSSRLCGLLFPYHRFAYYYVGIGFAVLILSTVQVWTFLIAATRQTSRIRRKFFFAVLHQEMAWFDSTQIGTLNTRLTE